MKNKAFDYHQDFGKLDFRAHPELYRVGKGEQGVLLVEPYKSELLPHWRFKTPAIAKQSAQVLYKCFLDYGRAHDFAGMDMARKFLQMGYTRARRYANHKSGQKYKGAVPADKKGQSGAHGRSVLPREKDPGESSCCRNILHTMATGAEESYLPKIIAYVPPSIQLADL